MGILETASLVIKVVGYIGMVMTAVSFIALAILVPKKNKGLLCGVSLIIIVLLWLLTFTRARVVFNWTLLLIGISMLQNVFNILNWKTKTLWIEKGISNKEIEMLERVEEKYGIDREHIDFVDLGTLNDSKIDKITAILIDAKYTYRAKKVKEAETKSKVRTK